MGAKKIEPFALNLGNGCQVEVTEVEDVDLDTDPITLPDGTVLDEAAAEALAEKSTRPREGGRR